MLLRPVSSSLQVYLVPSVVVADHHGYHRLRRVVRIQDTCVHSFGHVRSAGPASATALRPESFEAVKSLSSPIGCQDICYGGIVLKGVGSMGGGASVSMALPGYVAREDSIDTMANAGQVSGIEYWGCKGGAHLSRWYACHSKLMAHMYFMARGCEAQKSSALGPRYSVSPAGRSS